MESVVETLLKTADKVLDNYKINQIMQLTLGILNIEDIKWRNKNLDPDTKELLDQVETLLKAELRSIIDEIRRQAEELK